MKPANDNPLVDLALGAVAGAAATWVMGKVTTYLYEQEGQQVRQREDRARGGSTAYETAAKKAAGFAGRELSEEESKKLGSAIHWAIGVSAGAVHGLLRRRLAGRGLGRIWPWAPSSARRSGCCWTRRATWPWDSLPALGPSPGRRTPAAWPDISSSA